VRKGAERFSNGVKEFSDDYTFKMKATRLTHLNRMEKSHDCPSLTPTESRDQRQLRLWMYNRKIAELEKAGQDGTLTPEMRLEKQKRINDMKDEIDAMDAKGLHTAAAPTSTGTPIDRFTKLREKTRSNELKWKRRGLEKHNEFRGPEKERFGDEGATIAEAFRLHSGTSIPAALETLMDLESMWDNPVVFVDHLKSATRDEEWRAVLSNPSGRYKRLVQGLFTDRFTSSTAFKIQADVAHAVLAEIRRVRNSVLPYGINVEYHQHLLSEVSKLKSVLESCARPMLQFPKWRQLMLDTAQDASGPTLLSMVASYDHQPSVEYNDEADTDLENAWVKHTLGWGSGWDEMVDVTVDSNLIFRNGPGSVDCQELFDRDPKVVMGEFEMSDRIFAGVGEGEVGHGKGVTHEADIAGVVCEVNVQSLHEVSPKLLQGCISVASAPKPGRARLALGEGDRPRPGGMDELKGHIKKHFWPHTITSVSIESAQDMGSLQVRFAFHGVDRQLDIFDISADYMHDRHHYLKILPASQDNPASVALVSVKMNSDARGKLLPFNEDLSAELGDILG
jgi:hypothetical protein